MVLLVRLVKLLWSPGAAAPAGLALSSIVEGREAVAEDRPTVLRTTPGPGDTPPSLHALQDFSCLYLQRVTTAIVWASSCCGENTLTRSMFMPNTQPRTCAPTPPHPHPHWCLSAKAEVSGLLPVLLECVLILIG